MRRVTLSLSYSDIDEDGYLRYTFDIPLASLNIKCYMSSTYMIFRFRCSSVLHNIYDRHYRYIHVI